MGPTASNADMRPAYPGPLAQWPAEGGKARGYVEAALSRIEGLWVASHESSYRERLLARMSPGQRAAWSTRRCWSEVQNGGFSQLFFNSSGDMVHEAIAGFRLLGAHDHAMVFVKACAVFPDGCVPKDRVARWAALDRGHARDVETFKEQISEEGVRRNMLEAYQRILADHDHVWEGLAPTVIELLGTDYFDTNLDKILSEYVDAHADEFFAVNPQRGRDPGLC
jgi:hypothetical protein